MLAEKYSKTGGVGIQIADLGVVSFGTLSKR
jgi:hypothetical protein